MSGSVVAVRTSLVSATDRRSAAAGLCLAITSRPGAVAAQRALWAAVSVAGPRVLPGRREAAPPVDAALAAEWRAALGPFDDLAYYRRPQASRDAGTTALLLRGGQPVALVKVRTDPAPLAREVAALTALDGGPTGGVVVPRLLGHRLAGARPWLAQQVVARRPHRPAWPTATALATLADAVAAALAPALDRHPGTPAHWRPAHLDLTPWNLRRAGRDVVLVDWEDAAYAPPDADRVHLTASCAASGLGPRRLRRPPPRTPPMREAAAFWLARTPEQPRGDTDDALTMARRVLLRAWASD